MTALFTISSEPDRDLVRITMAGFYLAEDVVAFRTERDREMTKLHCGPNCHLTIVDVREIKIQSQDMVEQFHRVLAEPKLQSLRLAFIVATSLARTQLTRAIANRPSVRCFTEPAEAEDWVLHGDALAA